MTMTRTIIRPYNKFLENPPTRKEARRILSKLLDTERAYIWLANGKVRRIDGCWNKVWLDFRLNYRCAYMIHNHPHKMGLPHLSSYDIEEANELGMAATEVVCHKTVKRYRPGHEIETWMLGDGPSCLLDILCRT